MSEAKHTPGPWEVGHEALDVLAAKVKHGPMKVCDIRGWGYLTGGGHGALGLPQDEAKAIQEANARLIAAAPDMLAALKLALAGFEAFEESARGNSDLWLPTVLAFDTISAAIAKAEGCSVLPNSGPLESL